MAEFWQGMVVGQGKLNEGVVYTTIYIGMTSHATANERFDLIADRC